MRRRDFVRKAALGATALGGTALAACGGNDKAGGGPATHTKKRIRWRLASSFPRGLDTIYGGSEVLSKAVEAMSGGQFTIRCYPAGEIVPGLQVLDAIQQGTVEVGQTASYYYTGKHPALAFDTSVPFGLTARQQVAWLEQAGGNDALAPVFEEFGVKRFLAGGTGTQMGGWFRKTINSPEDLRGLKMRIPGMGGDVMSRLGATVQVLAGGDIYAALERGAIDATEWIGPHDDEKLGFHKVAEHYYYPGWWEPGPTLSYYVNEKDWAKLPAEYQAIFEAAAQMSASWMQVRYDAKNPEAFTKLREYGTKISPFPESVMTVSQKESEALLAEHAGKDATFKKIFDHWNAFRTEANAWFGTAEQAYAAFAMR